MNPMLRDLFGHQFWADIEQWSAIGTQPPARDDKAIRDRLHHIHQVQRAFVWGVSPVRGEINITRPDDFPAFEDLRAYAQATHDQIRRLLDVTTDDDFERSVAIPWFKDPPLTLTVAEALTQCAMHSHYHRGQNATRLRELGGTPPSTDLIVWYWKGRPAASWESF